MMCCGLRVEGWPFKTGEDAGPEAGVATKTSVKMASWSGFEGGLVTKILVLNYTHLHEFTRFYTMFLAVNVTNRIDRRLATDETRTEHRWERIVRPGQGRAGLVGAVP